MVKLRVAARVIPESDYTEAQSTQSTERRFLVVIRNPEEWYIGTLAVEIQNTYQRIYKHDLGRVKYLKDADDFDLDPEQLVSDVFVNEGKANRDGLDQDATIKIVREQGQAIRQGSVVPDLSPIHYQKRPLPPVPRFSEISSTLGKRGHDLVGHRTSSSHLHGSKRFRQADIDETHDGNEMMPSVERSPELIEDTQTSQENSRRANIKFESPELSRSFRNIAPATEDELELLPEMPPGFPVNRRNYVLGGEHVTPKANGVLNNAARRSSAADRNSQLPITPPTDPAVTGPRSRGSATNGRSHRSRSPAPGASSTISKFKTARQNLYEMPESDIEDSQMSPRAKHSLPVPRLVRKMSSIENMPSQHWGNYEAFNAHAALDSMDLDDEANTQAFIAEKRHSVSMHNDFRAQASEATAPARRDGSGDEMEISATASDPKQSKSNQRPTLTVGKPKPTKTQKAAKTASRVNAKDSKPTSVAVETTQSQVPSEAAGSTPNQKILVNQKRKAARKEKKKQAEQSKSGVQAQPSLSSAFDASKSRRRSSDLDSPGEQLSQALQASALRPSASEVTAKLANAEKKDEGRPSTSGSGNGSGSTSASTGSPSSRRSSSSKMGSSPGRLGLGITNSPRNKKVLDSRPDEKKAAEPRLAEKLKQAKEAGKSIKNHIEALTTSKDVSPDLNETVVPSVEKSGKKGGRRRAAVENLDTQCGVVLDGGSQCGRALDCGSHSLQKKRAVPGRSQPFDSLLTAHKASKRKAKESAPKLVTPNRGSEQIPSTTKQQPSQPEATSSAAKASTSKIIPPWMTPDDYDNMVKANESQTMEEKSKEKKPVKEIPKPAQPAPAITVAMDNDIESASSSDSEDSEESESEKSESEQEKETAAEKMSKTQTPAQKKATKSDPRTKTPKAKLIRESTTPGSEFDDIAAKLKSIKHSGGSDTNSLLPAPPRSALKKKDSSDKSSASSSDVQESVSKKHTATTAPPSIARKQTNPASAKTNHTSDKPTPQTADTTPKPATLANSKTSSLIQKATPATASKPPPMSGLQKLKAKLNEQSREASKRSSPAATPSVAKGLSMGAQGTKKVFGDSSDESSSSESESDSSDSGAEKKSGMKGKGTLTGKGKRVSPSAVPDRSIRDVTPDDSSDED